MAITISAMSMTVRPIITMTARPAITITAR